MSDGFGQRSNIGAKLEVAANWERLPEDSNSWVKDIFTDRAEHFLPKRHELIQNALSFAVNSNAFCTADPDAVLSKIHQARAPASKLANCAASILR